MLTGSRRDGQNSKRGSVLKHPIAVGSPGVYMTCPHPVLRKWLAPLLVLGVACRSTEPKPQVTWFTEVPHLSGTNLSPWEACMFPHRANPAAVRRAQPCPPGAAATTVYTEKDLEGCWLITRDDGSPPVRSSYFTAPVRMRAQSSERLRERGVYDGYVVEPLAHIPDSLAMDTSLMTTFWRFSGPDSVSIIRTSGFFGAHLSFRIRVDSLVGILQDFTDVVEMSVDTTTDSVPHLRAQRVRCPSPNDGTTTASTPRMLERAERWNARG